MATCQLLVDHLMRSSSRAKAFLYVNEGEDDGEVWPFVNDDLAGAR